MDKSVDPPDCEYVPSHQWLLRLVKNGRSALVVNFSDLNMILFSGVAHHAIST